MLAFVNLVTGIALSLLLMAAGTTQAATYVYVSNAEDGNIGRYTCPVSAGDPFSSLPTRILNRT